jgi:2-polyprenyl-3-methyl-5-hydroxy-6-metoxy-1,4-benzoquinol methylase
VESIGLPKWDSINNEFYNVYGDHFDKIPFENVLPELISKYVTKSNSKILEIGSGAGALALWMTNLGHDVTCIEPAEKPAEKAREKKLRVHNIKFQDFQVDQKFDYILAISSLIHIPRLEIPFQIKKMSESLEKEGIAFVSFIEGREEGYEDPTNKGKMRFFSKFLEGELTEILSQYFSIVEIHKLEVKKMNQSFFLFVLKSKIAT